LRIAIASHIALDKINGKDGYLGGAAAYCGLICRQLGFDTILATKVGEDFPVNKTHFLKEKGLEIKRYDECNTTRFELDQHGYTREIYLRSKCNPLTVDDVKHIESDAWIVSPLFDEVPSQVLRTITRKNKFVMLDPQGYMRRVSASGLVSIHRKITLNISGISAIKTDEDELPILDHGDPQFVISTRTRIISMNQYNIKLDHISARDSTGLGDILIAAFTCAYLKEKDPKWSLCYGAGAVKAALETQSIGIEKIPTKPHIDENASYLFSRV
jgi:sugar/nucleoside kinase (ribokinase family)